MSSRIRKKKRKPSSSSFAQPKTFDEAGVHAPSFIVGMVVSMLAILLALSQFLSPDSTPKTSKAAESVKPIPEDKSEVALKTADAEQLCNILMEENLPTKRDLNRLELESKNRERIEIADRLLLLELTEAQRVLAIMSKIKAQSALYGLDFKHQLNGPKVSEALRTVAENHARDSNSQIARTARLALLKHNAFERLKQPPSQASLQEVADEIIELLNDYPDESLSTIQLILQYYVNVNLSDASFLYQKMQAANTGNESTKLRAIMEDLSDRVKIRSLQYDTKFKNRWLDGAVGEKQLVQHSMELLSDPQFGLLIVRTVDLVTQWFEQEGKYDQATQIYRQMLTSAESNESPEVAALARKTAEFGLKREQLLNQKIDFSGVCPDGLPLDPGSFEKRVVIVVFWSPKNKGALKQLNSVFDATSSFLNKGVRILVVSSDQSLSESFLKDKEGVTVVVGDPEKSGQYPIWDQCPSTILPHAILVDQSGVVVDINIPISELKIEVGFLISQN